MNIILLKDLETNEVDGIIIDETRRKTNEIAEEINNIISETKEKYCDEWSLDDITTAISDKGYVVIEGYNGKVPSVYY